MFVDGGVYIDMKKWRFALVCSRESSTDHDVSHLVEVPAHLQRSHPWHLVPVAALHPGYPEHAIGPSSWLLEF